MKYYQSLTLRLLITLFSMICVLVLFELYLRREVTFIVAKNIKEHGGIIQQDPEFLVQYSGRGRRFVPNAEVTIYNHFISRKDVEVRINSLGFRGGEVAVPKPSGTQRVVVLGDSITAGDYLNEDDVYMRVAERRARELLPGKSIEFINTGIGNIGTEEEVNILEDSGLSLQPDVVVVGYYLNDTRPPWGFAGEIGDRGWLRRHSLLAETIYRNLKEYKWKEEQGERRFGWIAAKEKLPWATDHEKFLELAHAAEFDWGAAWEKEAEEINRRQFMRLSALAAQHHFKVLLIVFPVSFQVYAQFLEDSPQRQLALLAKEFDFQFLDLLPLFRDHNSEAALFFDQCHPTERGNALVGEKLAETLVKDAFLQ